MDDLGVMFLENWSPHTINLDDLPAVHQEFVATMTTYPGIGRGAANHAWRYLREMSIGDIVVAYRNQRVYGWGTITGDYQYIDDDIPGLDDSSVPHRRDVTWHPFPSPYVVARTSRALRQQLWGLGPRELTYDGTIELLGGPAIPDADSLVADASVLRVIPDTLAANGLVYTESQVATFYTAFRRRGSW